MKKGLFFKLDTDNPNHKEIIDFFNEIDHIFGKRHRTIALYRLIRYYLLTHHLS